MEPEKLRAHIKVFLSACDNCHHSYYPIKVEPFGTGKGNFTSLLNFVDQIEHYGPARDYWDGTHESFIQNAKYVLTSIRKSTSYMKEKLAFLLRVNSLQWIQTSINNELGIETPQKERKKFHRYTNKAEIEQK